MGGFKKGLEGVIATETSISYVDGENGRLLYRGYDINELAEFSNFEEATYLLWFNRLPKKEELDNFRKILRSERGLDKKYLKVLKGCEGSIPMDALRTSVSFISHFDADLTDNSFSANIRKGIRLAAKFPTIVASHWRLKQHMKPIEPRSDLAHGENFLYMLTGKIPNELSSHAMEQDFLLTAEHEINASTFTARIPVSTLSDLHSAIVAAICTLKGPLHGAAREEIYKLLDEIGIPENAESCIMDKLSKKEKISGFGHRVYKTMDPRAKILKRLARELAESKDDYMWFSISENVEKTVLRELVEKQQKPIYPNVDFYTAAIYKYLNIPMELTTSIFAIGRIAGWTAHCLEQYADNRLIRPLGEYIGQKNLRYIPIGKR